MLRAAYSAPSTVVAELKRSAKMKTAALLIFLSLIFSGCSIPRKMTGQFTAPNSEFIVIKKDGAVYWSPASKSEDKLSFFGIASPENKESLEIPLVVASASPFLYSKLKFSDDYSHITVDWGRKLGKDPAIRRATEYERQK